MHKHQELFYINLLRTFQADTLCHYIKIDFKLDLTQNIYYSK